MLNNIDKIKKICYNERGHAAGLKRRKGKIKMSRKRNRWSGIIVETLLIVVLFAVMIISTSCEKTDTHIHTYSSWTVTKDPTCTEEGEKYRACPCGETQTYPVEALGHTEVIHEAVLATCTSEGLTEGRECSTCGLITMVQETTPILDHRYSNGECTGCKKKLKASRGLVLVLSEDGSYYSVAGKGTCMDDELYIPSTYNNLPVKEIGSLNYSINYAKLPNSIIIPASITNISSGAFHDVLSEVTNLAVEIGGAHYYSEGNCIIDKRTKTLIVGCQTSIIPADGSVTSIGEHAFSGSHIKSVTIPNTVKSIGIHAFARSDFITITIPNSVSSIGEGIFESCSNLTSIIVENENSVYHSNNNCLIKTATKTLIAGCNTSKIPDDGSVTSIADYAFYECRKLTSITIPESVTSIGKYAFSYCIKPESLTIPNGVTHIGEKAFAHCIKLKSLILPSSLLSIGKNLFEDCSALESVTIPDGVTSIGNGAFNNCEKLTSITIPDSVTSIAHSAFSSCENLKDVYFTGTEAEWQKIFIGIANSDLTNATIHYNSKN